MAKLVLGLLLVLCTAVRLSQAAFQCSWKGQGGSVDLSSLQVLSGKDYTAQTDAPSFAYEFNICGASTTALQGCSEHSSAICETLGGGYVTSVASWPPNNQTGLLPVDPNDLAKGFEISFSNGELCYPTSQPRTARIVFVCSNVTMGPATGAQSSINRCDSMLTVPTSLACVTAPPPTTDQCRYSDVSVGVAVDLSPLQVLSPLSGTDAGGFTYSFSPCTALPVSTTPSACSQGQGEICETISSKEFVAVYAKYPASTGLAPVDPNDFTQGFQVSFANGDPCFPNMRPRTAIITYTCGSVINGPVTVSENNCHLQINVSTSLVCVGAVTPRCGAQAFNHFFNFSSLTQSDVGYLSQPDVGGYTYVINPCGALGPPSGSSGVCWNASVCQYQGNDPVTAVAYNWANGTWALADPSDPYKGVTFSIANGDSCFPTTNPRVLNVLFVCSLSPVGDIYGTSSDNNCHFSITFPTRFACYDSSVESKDALTQLRNSLVKILE